MLKLKDLHVQFTGRRSLEVVSGVNLTVMPGENTIVIGESGSGKSMILLAVLGLLPAAAKLSGAVEWNNQNLLTLTTAELERIRGREIAYIPQGGGNGLNPVMRIGKQLTEGIHFETSADRRHFAIRLLTRFGFGNADTVSRAYPHRLSGGMKQRVLIAMGTAREAQLILADEPTKGLDKQRGEEVIQVFKALQDRTLLCVTHDLAFAKAVSDKIVVLYASKVLEYGTRNDFFSRPLHPYSQALLAALPENGLQVLDGFAPPHEELCRSGCVFFARCPKRMKQCKTEPPFFHYGMQKVRCWRYADATC